MLWPNHTTNTDFARSIVNNSRTSLLYLKGRVAAAIFFIFSLISNRYSAVRWHSSSSDLAHICDARRPQAATSTSMSLASQPSCPETARPLVSTPPPPPPPPAAATLRGPRRHIWTRRRCTPSQPAPSSPSCTPLPPAPSSRSVGSVSSKGETCAYSSRQLAGLVCCITAR
jgi:hypothetical protein